MNIGIDTSIATRGHSAVHLNSIIRHAQIRINPIETILELWMSKEEILAGSSRAIFGTDRLFHFFQFDAHIVDVSVDRNQIHILVLLRSSTGTLVSTDFTFASSRLIFLEKNFWRNNW